MYSIIRTLIRESGTTSTHKEAMLHLLGQVGGRIICWGVALTTLTSENDILASADAKLGLILPPHPRSQNFVKNCPI